MRIVAISVAMSLALCVSCAKVNQSPPELRVSIMSFNAWGAGANENRSIDDTVNVIRHINPDIVGLQEARGESLACTEAICPPDGPGRAADIARALGYYVYSQETVNEALWANAIISRYPIVSTTQNELGVVLQIGARRVAVFNIHASDFPYQPYQASNIAYGDVPFLKTEAELVAAAEQARGSAIALLLEEIAAIDNIDAVLVTGDFNEPSHRDWTARAAKYGVHPLAVSFPAARRMEAAGFVDAYRTLFPDEITHPGFTWTPTTTPDDPHDHHDRIDYIFVRANGLRVESVSIAGEVSAASTIQFARWPSDHRAVVATIAIRL